MSAESHIQTDVADRDSSPALSFKRAWHLVSAIAPDLPYSLKHHAPAHAFSFLDRRFPTPEL
jgi:hypothetical protein